MTRYLILVVLVILVVYGLVEALPVIVGPNLSIASPSNDGAFPNGIVTVSGKAARAAVLTLNGAAILHQEDGSFSSVLTLPRGGSILTFVATDRFGKRVTATRDVFVPFEN
ncbi:MAG: hypothetical protein WCS97_03400 [Candidatus Paceibacterota bacterium]|jgi:hypothetical protein